MSGKSENPEETARTAAGRVGEDLRERTAMPGARNRPAGRDERRKLRNLLGDYSEQTGAFFG